MSDTRKERVRYALLKMIEENTNLDFHNKKEVPIDYMGISNEDAKAAILFLSRNNYIEGSVSGSDMLYTTRFISITEKGERYLKDNSLLTKAYRTVKEIKDFIPFISG
ncbi:YjcQ family protein [Latilactobacillus curvatus]|uniref:YjcQ family protein n=1 Tax=Latilactobacillus curvatus TaxID=28038 RepID=UPI00241141D1|nr:YjcQ family protein [Latilactobacillus curvatus]MDG2984344.1 YjcQ family protein [Latilactobacillus curvatus]